MFKTEIEREWNWWTEEAATVYANVINVKTDGEPQVLLL